MIRGLTVNSDTGEITIARGDDQTVRFTVTDYTGAVVNCSAGTFLFTVKQSIDDDISVAEFQLSSPAASGIDLTSAASGIVDVIIGASDTQALAGKYWWDLQMTLAGNVRTLAGGVFRVAKDVSTVGTVGAASAPVVPFPGSITLPGVIVSGCLPTYREIIVDPNGTVGCYLTIQDAINYALPLSSASSPWTIRLLPGIYEQTAVLDASSAQYLTIVGAGMDATIINRATALDDSESTLSISTDPVLNLKSSVGCKVMNLTIRHQGTPQTAPTGRRTSALVITEATGFRAYNARFVSTYEGVGARSTSIASPYSEAVENIFSDCILKVVGPSDSALSGADTLFIKNQYVLLLNSYTTMESDWQGPDDLRFDGGHLRVVGGFHARVYTGSQTFVNNSGSGNILNITPGGSFAKFTAEGARFDLAFTGSPTINGSVINLAAMGVYTGTMDYEMSFHGCSITWITPTITAAQMAGGIILNLPSTGDATLGTLRLVGTSIRELGGSGGTLRKDVMIVATASGGNRLMKAVYQQGSRLASIGFRIPLGGGAPTITGDYGKTENTINRQTGTATLAAGTAVVTMPNPMGVLGAVQMTDYSVAVEPNANEYFWITAKSSTQFTINSSNGASTATVRYTVTR